MSKSYLSAIVCVLSFTAFGHASANLITNGDFENGNLSGGVAGGFGPFLTMSAGSSAINGWVVGAGGVNLWTDYKGTGNHVIDIIGDSVTAGGSLAQTFTTIAGMEYHVSFDLSGADNPDLTSQNNPVKQMDITLFGADLSTVLGVTSLMENTSGWNGDFRPISFNFFANGSQAMIKFEGLNSGWNGYYIDNVVVSAVPVPATAWLLASGLITLFGIARQRTRS